MPLRRDAYKCTNCAGEISQFLRPGSPGPSGRGGIAVSFRWYTPAVLRHSGSYWVRPGDNGSTSTALMKGSPFQHTRQECFGQPLACPCRAGRGRNPPFVSGGRTRTSLGRVCRKGELQAPWLQPGVPDISTAAACASSRGCCKPNKHQRRLELGRSRVGNKESEKRRRDEVPPTSTRRCMRLGSHAAFDARSMPNRHRLVLSAQVHHGRLAPHATQLAPLRIEGRAHVRAATGVGTHNRDSAAPRATRSAASG